MYVAHLSVLPSRTLRTQFKQLPPGSSFDNNVLASGNFDSSGGICGTWRMLGKFARRFGRFCERFALPGMLRQIATICGQKWYENPKRQQKVAVGTSRLGLYANPKGPSKDPNNRILGPKYH